LFLSSHLDLIRVRDLDLRSEAGIEKSAYANHPAVQTRHSCISRFERFAVAWKDRDRKIPALAWPESEHYARPPIDDAGNAAFHDNGCAGFLGEGWAIAMTA